MNWADRNNCFKIRHTLTKTMINARWSESQARKVYKSQICSTSNLYIHFWNLICNSLLYFCSYSLILFYFWLLFRRRQTEEYTSAESGFEFYVSWEKDQSYKKCQNTKESFPYLSWCLILFVFKFHKKSWSYLEDHSVRSRYPNSTRHTNFQYHLVLIFHMGWLFNYPSSHTYKRRW